MAKRKIRIGGAKVLILGYTFKENCPDARNTKSLNLYHELIKFSMDPFVYDPYIDNCDLKGINIIKELSFKTLMLVFGIKTAFFLSSFNLFSGGDIHNIRHNSISIVHFQTGNCAF